LIEATIAVLLSACGGHAAALDKTTPDAQTASPSGGASEVAPTNTVMPSPTPLPPTSTPVPSERRDIKPTHLSIPSLSIDESVQPEQIVQGSAGHPPGCPPYKHEADFEAGGWTTVAVPQHGVATLDEATETVTENKAWVFGHSRWQGTPNTLFSLQDINIGDEVILDGVDRNTGEQYIGLHFKVTGIYIADVDSGADLLNAWSPDQIPMRPEVIMNTSARENGADKQWILDRNEVTAKATNVLDGDIDDPCKYLELWVIAEPTWDVLP
jgi:hypothetical protein